MADPLEIVRGADGARVLKVKADVHVEDGERVSTGVSRATVAAGWTRAIVLTVDKAKGSQRAFLLAPAPGTNAIELAPFHVRGGFEIVERVNNPRRARDVWDAFDGKG
jgi:hypothetical protein